MSGFLSSGLGRLPRLSFTQALYLLFFFFLPTQFGKHFFLPFSFVLGIRIDYLAPTVYVTDILLFLLFLSICLEKKTRPFFAIALRGAFLHLQTRRRFILLSLIILFALTLFQAPSVPLSLYGALRLSEIAVVAWITVILLSKKIATPMMLVWTIGASMFLQTGIVLLQFYEQSSLNGFLYFLGERQLDTTTPGVAHAVIAGSLLLRPYGTFSHPNVLAGFLLVSSLLLLIFRQFVGKATKQFALYAVLLNVVGIALAMSRSVLIVGAFCLAWLVFHIVQRNKESFFRLERRAVLVLLSIVLGLLVFAPLLLARFSIHLFSDDAILDRLVLLRAAFATIADNMVFGVGLNHFIPSLPKHLSNVVVQAKYLQPVHNAFILLLAEAGIVGGVFMLWIFKTAWRASMKHFRHVPITPLVLLVTIMLLSMTDHYFLTSQQGRLLLGFVFGLCFTKIPLRRV